VKDLISRLAEMGTPTIVVVGDVMLDHYVFGRVERISPEAPIQVLRADREEERPGGAASVATNLTALGAHARIVGYTGEDTVAQALRRLLGEQGVDGAGLVAVPDRDTTLKTRMIAGRAGGNQQVLRVDREDSSPYDAAHEQELLAAFETALEGAACVIVSDYAKGVLSWNVSQGVVERARAAGVPVIVDPKGKDYARYEGATLVTPNRKETREATGLDLVDRDTILAAGLKLLDIVGVDAAVVTLDKDGIALVTRDGDARVVPTTPRNVHDPTGAGDVVVAALGLGLAEGLDLYDAVLLANAAGGVEVSKVGAVPVTREEVAIALGSRPVGTHRVVGIAELTEALQRDRAAGRVIVFTNGCFDILHAGHVRYLDAAHSEGDVLVVGLNSDASVTRIKGAGRPVNSQADRAEMLASLASVDYVVPFEEDTPADLVRAVQPDVLVKGEDYRDKVVVGSDVVEARGGRVVLVPLLAGRSTTQLVERIRAADEAGNAD